MKLEITQFLRNLQLSLIQFHNMNFSIQLRQRSVEKWCNKIYHPKKFMEKKLLPKDVPDKIQIGKV